jgi:Zn-dependent peptidase ImmA (M78 family)
MIGQRLSLARRAAGLSLRELSAAIDNQVSAQAIAKYENDQMMPNSTALIALAEALGVTEEFLLSRSGIELVDAEFRKEVTGSRDEATLEARVLAEVERYLEIEDVLATNSSIWQQPTGFPVEVRVKEDAENAARKLRKQWDLGSDPMPNLVEFLEEFGIKVVSLPLPGEISGVMCWVHRSDGEKIPVIAINEAHDGERQRFSLAHELGHLVLVIPDATGDKEKEGFCHRFASAFLIPMETLVAKIGRHRRALTMEELFALKPYFGVSAQALAYRCKDLAVITDAAYRNFFRDFARRGWRKQEPMTLAPERPGRFGRLCYRALAEECISEAKAAELLQVPVRELDRRLHEMTGLYLQ